MKKVNFSQETDARLKKFLDHYCLPISENEDGSFIRRDAIQSLTEYQDKLSKEEDRLSKVIFHKTGEINQAPYIIVNVGHRRFTIPYEKEVVVTKKILNVINDCVVEDFSQTDKSRVAGDIEYETSYHKRFPYTFIEYMHDEDEGMSLPEDAENKKKK